MKRIPRRIFTAEIKLEAIKLVIRELYPLILADLEDSASSA